MVEPLLKLAVMHPATVEHDATVRNAAREMVRAEANALSVIEDCKIIGVFTTWDLTAKVTDAGLDPETTPVADVMSPAPICVKPTTRRSEAVELMVANDLRHIPIADDDGCLIGMLSLRELLGNQVTRLRNEVNSLELYLSVDGPGG